MTVIDLSGRVAVVTGASRGIGRAAAEGLLKAGCSVVLNARPSNEASASFAELEAAYPDRVTVVYGSVAESATAAAIAQSDQPSKPTMADRMQHWAADRETLLDAKLR